ncbi:MAG: hypothetical protein IJ879_01155, partial [Muribaculaceae bacterium]|nr:hypothetical protein [Muribaculaceae bacterium]
MAQVKQAIHALDGRIPLPMRACQNAVIVMKGYRSCGKFNVCSIKLSIIRLFSVNIFVNKRNSYYLCPHKQNASARETF